MKHVKILPQNVTVEKKNAILTNLLIFFQRTKHFLAHHPKTKKKISSKLLHKLYLWTLTRQFRQSCPKKNELQFWKVAAENPKKDKQETVKTFVLNFFLWKGRMQFWQTCRFFCRQPKSFTIRIRKQETNY